MTSWLKSYEPGSNDKVLRNLLGVSDLEEMNIAEANTLTEAADAILHEVDREHRFAADNTCYLHKL